MRSLSQHRSDWSGSSKSSELAQRHWNMLAIPAIILAVMAILQVVSFGKFKDWLDGVGVGWAAVVAIVIILAELAGAASLLQINMSRMMRFVGVSLAVLVGGFWFIQNVSLVSGVMAESATNSGFFGKYLAQKPGWWTVIEISILLFWLIYAAEIIKWRPRSWK